MDTAIVSKIVRDSFRWDKIDYPRADILTVAHDNDRSLWYKGSWYSPLIDTMEDDLRKRSIACVSVARIISRIKGNIAYGRVYSPEGAFARALVGKRLKGLFCRNAYAYSNMEESVWGEILDRVRPRRVFGIQPSRELCAACRKRGIWVADVQHGVISRGHPWYGEDFRGQDPLEHLPNAFLCWDFGSQAVIDSWAVAKGLSTILTGNRWIVRFVMSNREDQLIQCLCRQFSSRKANPTRNPAILVALSWGEVNIPNGFMIDALSDVIRATSDRYHWCLRLHPNQLNGFATHEAGRFEKFFLSKLQGHVEWEITTRSALPLVLQQSDLVIAWNSSVSIEAAQMGIRSALLDPRLRAVGKFADQYNYYCLKGMISLIEGRIDIIQSWIVSALQHVKIPENFDLHNDNYDRLIEFLAS
jgi:hypothetical protein